MLSQRTMRLLNQYLSRLEACIRLEAGERLTAHAPWGEYDRFLAGEMHLLASEGDLLVLSVKADERAAARRQEKKEMNIIVSRHPAAVEFIRRERPETAEAPVVAQATESDVKGKVVFGNLPLHLAAAAREVWVIEFTQPPRGQEYTIEEMYAAGARLRAYRVIALDAPQPDAPQPAREVIDYRAGRTHKGFALYVRGDVNVARNGVLLNVRLLRDGRTYVAEPGGEYDVVVFDTEGSVEALNDACRVIAHDSASNGVGKALIAFRPGGVLRLGAYKGRGPSRVLRYICDGRYEEVRGLEAARARGWLPPKNLESVL